MRTVSYFSEHRQLELEVMDDIYSNVTISTFQCNFGFCFHYTESRKPDHQLLLVIVSTIFLIITKHF